MEAFDFFIFYGLGLATGYLIRGIVYTRSDIKQMDAMTAKLDDIIKGDAKFVEEMHGRVRQYELELRAAYEQKYGPLDDSDLPLMN